MKIRIALAVATLFAATALAQTTMNIHTKSGVQKIAVTAIDSVTFTMNSVIPSGSIDGTWKFAYSFDATDSAGTVMTAKDIATYSNIEIFYQFISATDTLKSVVVDDGVTNVVAGKFSVSKDTLVFYTDSTRDTSTFTIVGETLRMAMEGDIVVMTRYFGTIPGLATTRATADPRGFFIPRR